nr:hypothetical protein [Streptomyces antimycoticus]
MPDREVLVPGIDVCHIIEQRDHRLPDETFPIRAVLLAHHA